MNTEEAADFDDVEFYRLKELHVDCRQTELLVVELAGYVLDTAAVEARADAGGHLADFVRVKSAHTAPQELARQDAAVRAAVGKAGAHLAHGRGADAERLAGIG